MQIIEFIENSGFSVWVRESPSILAYTTILTLHAMGLAIVVGINTAVSLRLLGFMPGIPLAPTLKLFPLMYLGFWINAISGLMLLAAYASSMLTNVMFFIKLGFIALAMVCLRLVRNRVFGDTSLLDAGPVPTQARLLAAGTVACWCGAIFAGRLTAYPYFVESLLGI